MNLLLTAIGKRIQLIEHLKTAFRVVGVDVSPRNAARYFVDGFYQVPGFQDEGYVDALLEICKAERIDACIPLHQAEFPILNRARDRFRELGVRLFLSEEAVLDICSDKRKTAAFFERHAIPAPSLYAKEEAAARGIYPVVVKPYDGMGSKGVFLIGNREELEFFYRYTDKPILQSYAEGEEYTVDALCDERGTPVYIVPRLRMEIRSGEVVKSRTVKQPLVIREVKRLLKALNREGRIAGPMTIQCFVSQDGTKVSFIEVNPRFGGGVPLAFAAGADYAAALAGMCAGRHWEARDVEKYLADFTEMTMLRYEQAVFVREDGVL